MLITKRSWNSPILWEHYTFFYLTCSTSCNHDAIVTTAMLPGKYNTFAYFVTCATGCNQDAIITTAMLQATLVCTNFDAAHYYDPLFKQSLLAKNRSSMSLNCFRFSQDGEWIYFYDILSINSLKEDLLIDTTSTPFNFR